MSLVFPKHKVFEKELRKAASAWFEEKAFPVHPRMVYCLAGWEHWEKNIILEEEAEYINRCKDECERKGLVPSQYKNRIASVSMQALRVKIKPQFNITATLWENGYLGQ